MNTTLGYILFGLGISTIVIALFVGYIKAFKDNKMDAKKLVIGTDISPLKYPAVLIAWLVGMVLCVIGGILTGNV